MFKLKKKFNCDYIIFFRYSITDNNGILFLGLLCSSPEIISWSALGKFSGKTKSFFKIFLKNLVLFFAKVWNGNFPVKILKYIIPNDHRSDWKSKKITKFY